MIKTLVYNDYLFEFEKNGLPAGSVSNLKIKDYNIITFGIYEDNVNREDIEYMFHTIMLNFDCEKEDIHIHGMKFIPSKPIYPTI